MNKTTIFVLAAAASFATAQTTIFTNDQAGYDAATGSVIDLFVDFETDSNGNAIDASIGTIDGGVFSNEVTYSSGAGDPLVAIGNIDSPIFNEIGPSNGFTGTLRWDYGADYFATSFTGIEVEADSLISFFNDGMLVNSVNVGGTGDTFQFFGFTVVGGFDAVELSGNFFAIDAHASTLVPTPGAVALLGLAGVGAARRRR